MAEGSGVQNENRNGPKPVKDAPSTFKSKVWAHFGFYQADSGTLDKEFAICKSCRHKVKYTGNTSNMHSHLIYHHPELAAEEKTASVSNASQPTINAVFKAKLPSGSTRAESITKSIACFICKDLRPYSVVENEGFRRMLNTLEPRYDIPCRKYFTEKAIPALYAETKAKVENALQSAERVALTCTESASCCSTDRESPQDFDVFSQKHYSRRCTEEKPKDACAATSQARHRCCCTMEQRL